jgi:hypothetical protein
VLHIAPSLIGRGEVRCRGQPFVYWLSLCCSSQPQCCAILKRRNIPIPLQKYSRKHRQNLTLQLRRRRSYPPRICSRLQSISRTLVPGKLESSRLVKCTPAETTQLVIRGYARPKTLMLGAIAVRATFSKVALWLSASTTPKIAIEQWLQSVVYG